MVGFFSRIICNKTVNAGSMLLSANVGECVGTCLEKDKIFIKQRSWETIFFLLLNCIFVIKSHDFISVLQ